MAVDSDARLLARIVQATDAAASVYDALGEALRRLCEHTGYAVGHSYMVWEETDQAVATSVWSGVDERGMAAFRRISEAMIVHRGEGVLGAVIETGVPVQLADITEEPRYRRRDEARVAGLRSCAIVPIVVCNRAMAALELYSRERRLLDQPTFEIVAACGVVLGRAVERHLRSIELDRRDAQLAQAREHELALLREQAARRAAEDEAHELTRLARELERSNRELDQFAYAASHDLKAPLRGIANLVSWLEADLSERLDEQSRRHMALLRGRVTRMESLIDGFLAYSRVGRGRSERELVDVRLLLDEVIDLLAPDPAWRIEIAPDMPRLATRQLLLRQVFHNLIGNALKHARSAAPRLRIGVSDTGAFHEFWVEDNGPGIDPRHHRRIWEIFQMLQGRDKVEGTGIGLALVRKIVEQQGGAVRLESSVGNGAAFFFLWPKTAPI